MCGIAGIWDFNKTVVLNELKQFTDSLYHRGPDGSGYKLLDDQHLGFGHRRLSILDLSDAGKQPMQYGNERYTMTYNGEVFNFNEIKATLEAKGHQFVSTADSEVVLAAYAEWGADCLHRFNGMWAMAIWDNQEKSLFLARDRFGIKPLYYLQENNRFAFASETYAFKYLTDFNRSLDEKNVELVKLNEYALEGQGYTVFQNIYQLLPGHFTIIKRNGKVQQRRWYDIRDEVKPVKNSYDQHVNSFSELFEDSCRLRLQSDVPLATALSGGLDSTSVYSTVYQLINGGGVDRLNANSQKAFTAIFPGLKVNEFEYAKQASGFVNGDLIPIEIAPENLIETIKSETIKADYVGKPISSISAIYKGMKDYGISVSMDGHGVDEMLYGYRDMVYGLYNYYLYTPGENPSKINDVLSNLYHPDDRSRILHKTNKEIKEKINIESSLGFKIKSNLKKVMGKESFGVQDFIPVNHKALSDKPYCFKDYSYPQRMLYFEFFQNTLPSLLRNFDRAGMMNSVEIRMPFMDYRLVNYVFSLPIESKIGGGYTKRILRDAMRGKIDESLRTRTFKVGIQSPLEYWLGGQLKEWAMDNLEGDAKLNFERAINENNLSSAVVGKAWSEINLKLIREN